MAYWPPDRGPTIQHHYGSSQYRRNRRLVLAGNPVCYCGCGRPATTADHIIPVSLGGTHDLANLRPAALSCNSSRGNRVQTRHHLDW